LSLSIEALSVIETTAPSPEDLQTSFSLVDECGNAGRILFKFKSVPIIIIYLLKMENYKIMLIVFFLGNSMDECSKAAEIYQCGVEKAPQMTLAIQNKLTNTEPLSGVTLIQLINNTSYKKQICRVEQLCPLLESTIGSADLLTFPVLQM